MNEDKEGMDAARAFIREFNNQDHHALAKTLNYPHIRLAGGRFQTIDSAENFANMSEKNKPRLLDEGWHHTEIGDMQVIHSDPDKVHLSFKMNRCNKEGTVYNSFNTLWIATLQDGHWGIQFRSSYLAVKPA